VLGLQVRESQYDSQAVVGFLRVLPRKIPGRLLVICDGSPIHRGQAVKDFLARGAAMRLHPVLAGLISLMHLINEVFETTR
jgi:hypothetical protein